MDIKINYEDWRRFRNYLPFARSNFYEELSAILFDLYKEKTTFEDIVETIKIYKEDLEENGSIDFVEIHCRRISRIDPIFFQEYYKEQIGLAMTDYQKQADYGAILFCGDFIINLYEKMCKDGLSSEKTKTD